ncbi:hypothetical protein SOVF_128900 [Spinacia oleracea]|nr:hypothetical protein SOVF_128900 [Spinacia oleracea]
MRSASFDLFLDASPFCLSLLPASHFFPTTDHPKRPPYCGSHISPPSVSAPASHCRLATDGSRHPATASSPLLGKDSHAPPPSSARLLLDTANRHQLC